MIELCEQIGIDTIMIGTFEYFSSLFKDFQVFGSNQFPVLCELFVLYDFSILTFHFHFDTIL